MSTQDETAAPDSPTRGYIPALGLRALTPLFDPLLRWVMREERFKLRLIQQADVRPDMRVLDLGCGTGTLTVMVKRRQPGAEGPAGQAAQEPREKRSHSQTGGPPHCQGAPPLPGGQRISLPGHRQAGAAEGSPAPPTVVVVEGKGPTAAIAVHHQLPTPLLQL